MSAICCGHAIFTEECIFSEQPRRFDRCVGEVVAQVVRMLGFPIFFKVNPASDPSKGLPDFAMWRDTPDTPDTSKEVVTGEGKVMHEQSRVSEHMATFTTL